MPENSCFEIAYDMLCGNMVRWVRVYVKYIPTFIQKRYVVSAEPYTNIQCRIVAKDNNIVPNHIKFVNFCEDAFPVKYVLFNNRSLLQS